MRQCRFCTNYFEPEAFEVFCSPECTSLGNSKRPDRTVAHEVQSQKPPLADMMTEEEFSSAFVSLAKELKWKGYHTRISSGSKEGYPDWTLWRERVIFVELKKESGVPSAAQLTTIEELQAAGAEVYVWKPSDWKELVKVLMEMRPARSS